MPDELVLIMYVKGVPKHTRRWHSNKTQAFLLSNITASKLGDIQALRVGMIIIHLFALPFKVGSASSTTTLVTIYGPNGNNDII